MIVHNRDKGTVLGEAIEVAETAVSRVKGLLGRECLEDGQGLLFKQCTSLHTLFMRFPIDILFIDRSWKVLKVKANVRPFKFIAAPWRAHYALELPAGAATRSRTKVGDHLVLQEEAPASEAAG